jgi:hypothetical protein
MSYIEQFEQELIAKLQGRGDIASVVRWVSEKVLESYKNGITAGRRVKRADGKGARREGGTSSEVK